MWRKAEENKARPLPDTSLSGVPSPRHPPAAAAPPASPNAPVWLSQGIRIKGEISGRGDLFLDGVFEENIHISDGSFTIGPNARVTAEIEARKIIVHGEVIGTLKGERVQVSGTGRVTGDTETRGIVIEDGAVLRSKVQVRQEDEPPQSPQPAVPAHAKEAVATDSAQASAANASWVDCFTSGLATIRELSRGGSHRTAEYGHFYAQLVGTEPSIALVSTCSQASAACRPMGRAHKPSERRMSPGRRSQSASSLNRM